MSQMKAKQIKLNAGQLILGGATGNLLDAGTGNNTVLRVVGGTVQWSSVAASEVSFAAAGFTATEANAAIVEAKAAGVDAAASVDTRVDNLNTALGISGDSFTAHTGTNYLDSSTSFRSADVALDAAIKAVADSVSGLGNAFEYVGTVTGGVDAGSATDLTLQTKKSAGDYYKVTTAGYFTAGGPAFFANVGDGLVWNTTAGVDVIDNTNSSVAGTANRVSVTGSSDTGFTVDIAANYAGQNTITTLGTVTTGTWNATNISRDKGGTGIDTSGYAATSLFGPGFSELAIGSANAVLRVNSNNDGYEFAYVTELLTNGGATAAYVDATTDKLTATFETENSDDALAFTTKGFVENAIVVAVGNANRTAAHFEEVLATGFDENFTLPNAPLNGSVSVFVNGVRLRSNAFTVSTNVVSIVPANLGYSLEETDSVQISYEYNFTG